jgi:small conductance mechanosensitive channel
VISGFFLLLENQYVVGDYITIGTISGCVEEVGMRTTHIRDDFGRICILSNGDITQVCNHSRGPAVAVVEIGIPPTVDLKELDRIIEKIGEELTGEGKILETKPTLDGIVSIDWNKSTLRIRARTGPGKRVSAEMALREALVRALHEANIDIV